MQHEDKLSSWIQKTVLGTESQPAPPPHQKGKIQHPHPLQHRTPLQHPAHGKLRIVPLGGLDEVGKNMMVVEYFQPHQKESTDIIIIDMGFQFPEEDMLGIDYVIPDTSYLEGKLNRIRGVILTHGHLDHIGGIPYLFKKLGEPIFYGTRLTIGLAKKRLEEFELDRRARLNVLGYDDVLTLGSMQIELFRVNHSIPDSAGVIVRSPVGTIVHTGDFKFDFTPADGKPADFAKMARLGTQNVIALFSDSTNATKPGYTISEKQVGITLSEIIKNISGRVIIATFSSALGRIQQIISAGVQFNRKVYLSGRSIIDNVGIAQQLGYIQAPPGTIKDIRKVSSKMVEEDRALILTTGSQGEALSALARMAMNDHASIRLKKGDTVVFSSSPIIGNERAITTIINNLCQMGIQTISNKVMDVHASGHGQQEDLKLMMNLIKPQYVVPVHGELYMRTAHAKLAESIGYPDHRVKVVQNGSVLEMAHNELRVLPERIPLSHVMIDGLGVGSIGSQVLMERQIMASNGVLVLLFHVNRKTRSLIGTPEALSRGFIYLKESQEVIDKVIKEAQRVYQYLLLENKNVKRGDLKQALRSRLDNFIHRTVDKTPLILPVIIEH